MRTDQQDWALRQDPSHPIAPASKCGLIASAGGYLMFHHFKEELSVADYLVRATHFTTVRNLLPRLSRKSASPSYKLIDGQYRQKSLPPVDFEYSAAIIDETVHEVDAASLESPAARAGRQGLSMGGSRRGSLPSAYLRNKPASGSINEIRALCPLLMKKENKSRLRAFPHLKCLPTMPFPCPSLNGDQQLLDLAGDGQTDVVEFDGASPGFFERTPDEEWDTLPHLALCPTLHGKTRILNSSI